MMASKNRVTVVMAYSEWGAEVEAGIVRAIDSVTPGMAEAAKTAEVRRASEALADSIHAMPAVPTPTGFEGGIGASDYKAGWYELGTLARRSKRKSNRGKSDKAAGHATGVKGLHYLRKGLYAGRAAALERISVAIREARGL